MTVDSDVRAGAAGEVARLMSLAAAWQSSPQRWSSGEPDSVAYRLRCAAESAPAAVAKQALEAATALEASLRPPPR